MRRLKATGFAGALRVVSEWATRRRHAESTPGALLRKPPSARTIARLITSERDRLSRIDARLVAVVEEAVTGATAERPQLKKHMATLVGLHRGKPRAGIRAHRGG